MTFEAFCELYEKDMRPRLKENTWNTKEHIIRTKLLPYFGKRRICEIETKDVIAWQNELLAYRDEKKHPYSATYLKIVHNQLTAILTHAVKHYGLKSNPASRVGCIGSKESEEMQFWTKDEYLRFAEAVMDKPMSYYAFEMLYWCGIREGKLLALTPGDFDFKKGTVSISKSYQRLHGEDVITSPKTRKSIRTIRMPEFLGDEMQDYIHSLYGVKKQDRMRRTLMNWNQWLRRRIRMYIWKRWKKPRTRVAALRKLGIPDWQAYEWGNTRLGYWRVAASPILSRSITDEKLAQAGYYDFPAQYEHLRKLHLCG